MSSETHDRSVNKEKQSSYREAYLDNAATTKPRPEVVQVMMRELQNYGNASSVHALGKKAKRVLEDSRAVVATALGAEPDEIFFTSGGTESNNLAIRGSVMARGIGAGRIITSVLSEREIAAFLTLKPYMAILTWKHVRVFCRNQQHW